MQGMNFLIDGRAFDPSWVDIRIKAGTVEDWTIRKVRPWTTRFISMCGRSWCRPKVGQEPIPSGWKDVVNVPAGGWVRLRIPFRI
jgi:FtsP/CotA-like multicopper oxidase with cupredoxin domain